MSATVGTDRNRTELQDSFDAFNKLSGELARAYDQLREQAQSIDTALADSNRRLTEKVCELDRTTSHLKAVLRSMGAAVIVTDLDQRVTLTNPALEELTGRSDAELRGRCKEEVCDVRGEPLCQPPDADQTTTRVVAGPDQRPRRLRSSISPILTPSGERLGEVEILVDETEVERLRQELHSKKTLSALGEMAAGIAHELRNPLSAVEGFAHLLQRQRLTNPEACEAHARRIVQGVRKVNSIITNLLCFARPERFRPHRTPVEPLFQTLREAYRGTTPAVTVERVRPRVSVRSDPALLERMFVNLIENARSVLSQGGRVRVEAREIGDEVQFRVTDDGPGIPLELRERLFLPFVTGRAEGTGLGLAIVHRIVDLHQGRLEVETADGQGTCFIIHLPRHRSAGCTTRVRHDRVGAADQELSQ